LQVIPKALYHNSGEITLWRFENIRIYGCSCSEAP